MPGLTKVFRVGEEFPYVVVLGLIKWSPAAQIALDGWGHPFVDVALTCLLAQNLTGAGDFEAAGCSLVGLHLWHEFAPVANHEVLPTIVSNNSEHS